MNDEEEETNPSPNESDDSIQSPAFGKDFESFDQCTPPRDIIEEDVENASQIDPAQLDIEAQFEEERDLLDDPEVTEENMESESESESDDSEKDEEEGTHKQSPRKKPKVMDSIPSFTTQEEVSVAADQESNNVTGHEEVGLQKTHDNFEL